MHRFFRGILTIFLVLALAILMSTGLCKITKAQSNSYKADLIIYGGTSAAVVAAVEMVKSGKSVLIVSPDTHLGGLIYGISGEPIAPNKTGDKKLQAYCFRVCMSNLQENRVPFPKPEKYNPDNYELMGRLLDAGWKDFLGKFDQIPNWKTDTNNNGPFSYDFIGGNYDYPEASYERRKEIAKEHENYQKGLLYYLGNDSRVTAGVREVFTSWGLAKDEFVENGNWPWQMYIRESRRMSGTFVTTENEVTNKNLVKDPVGMGSYNMDSHNVQRYVTPDGWVQNEGDVQVHLTKPYLISFGSILPKKAECSNLLVPVCVSSSHIAYGSIRMEPVFMILGQSAAIAASLAIDKKQAVQEVDYNILKQKLLEKKQVIAMP